MRILFPFACGATRLDRLRRRLLAAGLGFAALPKLAMAGEALADPSSYRQHLARLGPGQRLLLAPGVYERGLPVHGITGTREAPIVIEAADPAHPPVFLARAGHNTVSLVDCAWMVLRHLVLDGRGLGVDAVKA